MLTKSLTYAEDFIARWVLHSVISVHMYMGRMNILIEPSNSDKAVKCIYTNVETGSGQPGHIFSGSDPVYKLSRLDHMRNKIIHLMTWKLINTSRIALS